MASRTRMRGQERGQGRPAAGACRAGGLAAAALTGAALSVTLAAGPASIAGATTSHGKTIHISTAKVSNVGTVLTTSTGLTLYRFTQDPSGMATCTGACAKIWPPLLASKGAHLAGPKGVKGLSLLKVTGGHWQVAFDHVALYRFTGDKKKGQAKGQGVESAWYAVLKSGISATPNAAVSPPTAPTTPSNASTPTTKAPTPTTGAPHTATTSPPTTQTPVTQAPAAPTTTPPTQPPPTTAPPTTTTTTAPSTGGGGGVGF